MLSDCFVFLYIVNECLCYHPCAARGGVVAGEVPVTGMVGACLMQTIDTLKYQLYWRGHALGAKHVSYLTAELLGTERCINAPDFVFAVVGFSLGFLTAWWLGSRDECPKKARWKLHLHFNLASEVTEHLDSREGMKI